MIHAKDTALLKSNAGWNVIATMRSPEAGGKLPMLGNQVLVARLDVQDLGSIESAVATYCGGK